MDKKIKVLFDVDTGVDDSLALIYALLKDNIEIVGISTIAGNVEADLGAQNTLKILKLMEKDSIPVVVGHEKHISGAWKGRVTHIHGENGIGNVELPASTYSPVEEEVSDFHYSLAKKYSNELVVISLGPLTNIAKTIEKYPDFKSNIRFLTMMGGTLDFRGNVGAKSEANVAADPLACDIVFNSGIDVRVVGLDVTMKTRFKREHLAFMKKYAAFSNKKVVEYLNEAFEYYFEGNRIQNFCVDDCPLHDPLAVISVTRPELFNFKRLKARVETKGEYTRGMIVTDTRERSFEAEYVNFAIEVSQQDAINELLSVF